MEQMLFCKCIKIRHEEFAFGGLKPSGWLTWTAWMNGNGISYSQPTEDHAELVLMGRKIFMPKEFTEKALALGYLP
jgi:hypothetical protein